MQILDSRFKQGFLDGIFHFLLLQEAPVAAVHARLAPKALLYLPLNPSYEIAAVCGFFLEPRVMVDIANHFVIKQKMFENQISLQISLNHLHSYFSH